MKTKNLLLAAAALVALASCNKENPVEKEDSIFGKGDEAYLSVSVVSADADVPTKATGTTTESGFYYGSADDNTVAIADFFFYKEDGAFFSHVSQTIDGSAKTGEGPDNTSWVGKGIVILKGLTTKSSPAYMSVILNDNALASSLDGKSLSEAQEKVTGKFAEDGTTTALTNFTMTSSTYNNGNAASGYFCTKLTSSMFKDTEADAAGATGADIAVSYVERLAAKVQLSLGTTLGDGSKISLGKFKVGADSLALYVKVGKWGLNATTKNTYAYKVIDNSWDFGMFTWNDEGNYRSYWAKSTNYDDDTCIYADSYSNSEATPENNYKGHSTEQTLNYISFDECAVSPAQYAYCLENTNTEGELRANNFNTTATCALLAAQIVDETETPISLVLFENQLWTAEQYKTRVLEKYSGISAETHIPYLSTDGTSFTQITTENFKEVNAGDGIVYLQIADAPEGATYYMKSGSTYTPTTAAALNETVWVRTLSESNYYNAGRMYYSIPVEHLRQNGTFAGNDYQEADYGVVRNHWYRLTINSISKLGMAVYDPAEKILPNDAKTKEYYVGAQVNILSWKVINQNVDL